MEASAAAKKMKKKAAGWRRLWMRMDRLGQSELIECDKSVIINRCSIPARDLSILGPIFSQSSSIVGREKATIVNLEFIRAVVTAEEVFLLDPLKQEVLVFVDQLRRQLSNQDEAVALIPFEFQILEVALQAVCTYLESCVDQAEREAYPALDLLAKGATIEKLECVRNLKNNLIRLLGRLQKVRDKIEEVLEDDEDMAQLYLTRKNAESYQLQVAHQEEEDVEDLEMLLEAYLKRLDGSRDKIVSVREYIDETEEYVNIQLDIRRNELLEMQVTVGMASFAITVGNAIAGIFGINIKIPLYKTKTKGVFLLVVGLIIAVSLGIFLLLGYVRRRKGRKLASCI